MIKKNPQINNYYLNNLCFTYNARTAFSLCLKNILKRNSSILLPSYIGVTDREGSGVLDPINENGINFDFYKIKRDFQVDEVDLYQKLDTKLFKAVLIIHYFGFLNVNIIELSEYCKLNDVFLIEDCAHAFNSNYYEKKLGEFGDYSFFSLHKYFPSNQGGILKTNDNFRVETNMNSINIDDLLIYNTSNLDQIAMSRINNYNHLLVLLKDCDNLDVIYPELPNGVVPMNFPVIVKNNQREKLYFFLIEKGITTSALYYRLIDNISKLEYKDSNFLSRNILNLPIHQDIRKCDLKIMANEIKRFFNGNRHISL